MPTTQAAASTVDPAKWLAIVRRWCPADPVEVPITLVNSLIEAAATGPAAQLRLGLLDELVLGLDAQLCSLPQKKNKLKMWTARMANDTLRRPELRPGHAAELARAALAAVERAPDQVLSVEKMHTALRRVKPKISLESTYGLAKRLTDCGWLERVDAGVYGVPSRAREPYEPMTIKLLRLVYTAPDHEMDPGEALNVLGCPANELSATASELCSRKLMEKPEKGPRKVVFRVPAEIANKLERGEGILIAPGKLFYARPGGPPVDHSALIRTLNPARPPLGDAEVVSELRQIVAGPETEYEAQCEDLAKRSGLPAGFLFRLLPGLVDKTERRKRADGRGMGNLSSSVGSVFIPRACFGSESGFLAAPFSEREAWFWVLAEAAFKPHRRRIAGISIDLKQGQAAGSRRHIAKEWAWDEDGSKVRRQLQRWQKEGKIHLKSDPGLYVITVLNLGTSQTSPPESDPGPTQDRPKEKERREEGNNKRARFDRAPSSPSPSASVSVAQQWIDELMPMAGIPAGEVKKQKRRELAIAQSWIDRGLSLDQCKEIVLEVKSRVPQDELHTLRYFDREINGAIKKANWKPSQESIAMLVGKGYSEFEINSGLEQYRKVWLPGVELGVATDQDWLSWMLPRRPEASPGSGAQPEPCFYYAKDGSPQLDAWEAYSRRTRGIGLPRDKRGGWRVDAEWPPDHER